jgi:DNA protecting protein DprA
MAQQDGAGKMMLMNMGGQTLSGGDEMAPPSDPTLFDSLDEPSSEQEPRQEGEMPFAVALLALGSIRGLGFKSIKKLVAALGDNLPHLLGFQRDDVLEQLAACRIAGAKKFADVIAAECQALTEQGQLCWQQLTDRGVTVVPPSRLPARLREGVPDRPQWLFVQGNAGLLESPPAAAVVGTRTPTQEGLRATSIISQILAPYPIVLVSGLAEGIDEQAHNTSLDEGIKNLAFLGHGINHVFPYQTGNLRERMVRAGGAVVSEYLPDEKPSKPYFVARNRLQAALADVVIPVEAKKSGGTAHTVRFAKQYGRPVVGIRWPRVNGVVAELERQGATVIDILTQAGCKQLDGLFRRLTEDAGKQGYALAKAEQRLLSEIRSRDTRDTDILRLINYLKDFLNKEPPTDGTPQGGHLRR